ncbi:MAG: hypothetical protein K8R90_07745 [Candidatus Cloacimonetes bacterium]|nr:hypothetical protein [Candidatus Cloacimonadota bacterium]
MKKLLWFAIPMLTLLLTGCSEDGEISVTNGTQGWMNVTIDGDGPIELAPDETVSKSWSLATSIFGDDSQDIDLHYTGLFIFSGMRSYSIKAGYHKYVTLDADGGAIRVFNTSAAYTITEVYISPNSDTEWGDNDLSGDIGPGGSATWTVSPGIWDIRVVDNLNEEYTLFGLNIILGSIFSYYYPGFGAISGLEDIKSAAQPSALNLTPRVQQIYDPSPPAR